MAVSHRLRSVVRELAGPLAALDDPRAAAVLEALPPGRRWDLQALEAALAAPDPEAHALQAVGALRGPVREQTRIVTDALLAAASEAEDTRHATALDERGADLVRAALAWHETHGDRPCPLCGTGQLGKGWRGWAELWLAERQLSNLRGESALEALARAEEAARELTRTFEVPSAPGLDTSALTAAVASLAAAASLQGRALATAIDERVEDVEAALLTITAAARDRLAAREARWRPLAVQLAAVLAGAREADPRGGDRREPAIAPADAPRAV